MNIKQLIKNTFPQLFNTLKTSYLLLRQPWTKSIFARQFYLVYPQLGVRYVAVPKTGNSTVNAALLAKECDFTPHDTYHSIHHLKRKYAVPKYRFTANTLPSFAVVRNPYDRLVSCYKNKVLREDYFSSFHYYGRFHKDMSFDEFVRQVHNIPHVWADPHFQTQSSILCRGDALVVDTVFTFEEFPRLLQWLQEHYRLTYDRNYNTSSEKSRWQDYYHQATADLVYNKYRKDFDLFAYERESWCDAESASPSEALTITSGAKRGNIRVTG